MKKATLVGLIGVVIITLISLYYVITNLTAEHPVPIKYIIPNIISLVGWCGLVYFFVELYKKQK